MTTNYTPGPWETNGRDIFPARGGSDTRALAECYRVDSGIPEIGVYDAEANARLMAAAPELLASLSRLERLISQHRCGQPFDWSHDGADRAAVEEARKVIAQALGKSMPASCRAYPLTP